VLADMVCGADDHVSPCPLMCGRGENRLSAFHREIREIFTGRSGRSSP
jgi:hypothetical protein